MRTVLSNFSIYHECCPVKYYETFRSHHPVEMNEPESSFYFTNKHKQNPGDHIRKEVRKLVLKVVQNNCF